MGEAITLAKIYNSRNLKSCIDGNAVPEHRMESTIVEI